MRGMLVLVGSVLCLSFGSPAWADKDKGHGHGHGHGHKMFVTERDRVAVYSFYRTEFVGGRCPPGLARRDNGCLPPGQARRLWALGAPLPPSMVFYPLPASLLAQLTPAPEGHQYVRVDNDILLMTLGTRLVVESVGSIANLQDANRPLISERDRTPSPPTTATATWPGAARPTWYAPTRDASPGGSGRSANRSVPT